MTPNLVAIAGVPHYRQGQLPIGQVAPTPEQQTALNWAAVGFFSAAALIAYVITRRTTA